MCTRVHTLVCDFKKHKQAVFESLITIDFVDQISLAKGKDRLVPSDPYEAARCRVWTEKLNKECCSPYYGVLGM